MRPWALTETNVLTIGSISPIRRIGESTEKQHRWNYLIGGLEPAGHRHPLQTKVARTGRRA
jgi:hypothetical protein